jgi:DNA-binding response OmpR family regulator
VERLRILVVEDNKADLFLIRDAITQAAIEADVQVAEDGDKAVRWFGQAELGEFPCPTLVILDINLPRKHGAEVLGHIRKSCCAQTLVIVVTSSDSERDRGLMASLGVNGYFRKPSSYAQYLKLGDLIRELLGMGRIPEA